ncbi:MAG: EAL domain-containing protein [Ruminococcus sp.]|nr:EAL domain-containing protein [Ruminococcus sp.]
MSINNDAVFTRIAVALLTDYTSVYYVNVVTNEYQWYSASAEFHSLQLEQGGKDFFADMVRDAARVVFEEDRHIFIEDMQKDKLLSQMKNGITKNIEYRLMIDGRPVYHSLRIIRSDGDEGGYIILGVKNIDKIKRRQQEAEIAEQEREIYNQIAGSLAEHYNTIYYIDMQTNEFFEYSSNDLYKRLHVPQKGSDFFAECKRNIPRIVHPDDRDMVARLHVKEVMLENLRGSKSYSAVYRIRAEESIFYVRLIQMWVDDGRHAVVCIEDIDEEIKSREKTKTYSLIAESLAAHYDVIYYIDLSSGEYMEYTSNSIFGSLEMQLTGLDFFGDVKVNIAKIIHPDDRQRLETVMEKDYLITALEDKKQVSIDYRMIVDGKPQFTRLTGMWSSDKIHLIIGVENINEAVKKQKEQIKALNQANELARRDELTGTRNKNAYHELESSVEQAIASGEEEVSFAVVVCDINNLKLINDTYGHRAGDDYIKTACSMICNVFSHSPVFRVGGDEFVVFLTGRDLSDRKKLLSDLRMQVIENLKKKEGPVVAVGCSVFDQRFDSAVSEVFERADGQMYEEKSRLKEMEAEADQPVHVGKVEIPQEVISKLDSLFEAFSLVSDESYVFLCNMRYDYSRWSRTAVDSFGLPSEYMYEAGSIWEEHIHPDDRETYRRGISEIFSGRSAGHDMQYRAMKINGEYTVCTCRGIVLRDEKGEPEYFCGSISDHGQHSNIDTLTGLRNQYGFFEDLQAKMLRNIPMRISMVGISKFSEINEIYGYHFGNRVLQSFGRYLFEYVGNLGSVYRLDGTKFAVISCTQTPQAMLERYDSMREYFRGMFTVGGRSLILDLNAGLLAVDNFLIDYQTVYACLNFAYGESKLRRQGDMVEFYNDLNDENKRRIEKLHAIRASIMRQFSGFYLMYQPVVDADTEMLIGAEALLRWKDTEYGTVPPDQFIPMIERDPLFPDLGQWILRTAVNDAKKILGEHPDFIINVNLSYTQLEKPDFVDMVFSTLEEADFSPKNLCLEITERCRLLNIELLRNIIVALRSRGVKIALDDFGTGFSSVGLVKDLPFDTIKIDRSFVQKIENDDRERELIKSFASVASTFGAEVCVEGIESAGMISILKNYSVHSFQGYYYAKPLALGDFMEWRSKNIGTDAEDDPK